MTFAGRDLFSFPSDLMYAYSSMDNAVESIEPISASTSEDNDEVFRIIDEVQALLDVEGHVEPTPIDPHGVHVVDTVPVTATSLHEDNNLTDFLNSLLLKPKRKLSEDFFDTNFEVCKKQKSVACKEKICKKQKTVARKEEKLQEAPTDVNETSTKEEESADETKQRFRAYQAEQWYERFQDMIIFHKHCGHCFVPHTFPQNPHLAQWVKRQRYQYKLKHEDKHSTLTDERQVALEQLGFVWDSHGAAWMERCNELADYRKHHGHSNVPTNYTENRQLSIWVKCQRRQFRLYSSGGRSNMTPERIGKLESFDFVWNPRGLKDMK